MSLVLPHSWDEIADLMLAIYTDYEIADLAALTGFAKMRLWETSGTAALTNRKADLILAIYAGLTMRSLISF